MALILITLSALLLTAANYNGNLFFMSWIALSPFFYYLFIFKNRKLNYRKIFCSGWYLGFLILVFSANFLYYPIKLYTGASFYFIILLLFLIFLFMSLIYGIFFLIYFYLQSKLFSKQKIMPLLFAFCWTIMEIIRYYLFRFFPIANPAYTQAEFLNFIQLAEIGGVWILTFILILVNVFLFQLIFQKNFKKFFPILFVFLIVFSFGYLSQQIHRQEFNITRAGKLKVGIITTEIKQQKKWTAEQLEKNIELSLNAAAKLNKSRIIIAPETNITFDFNNNNIYRREFLEEIAAEFEVPIQIGSIAGKNSKNGNYNSSFLISPAGKIISRYDKNLLLYFGEKYPFLELINKYTPYKFSSLNAGQKQTLFRSEELLWKTVICSEILYPDYVHLDNKEIDFIVNQTNEAWFNESKLLKNIMWQAAVLRAVENRIPVIKTGNRAENGIIYPSGTYHKGDSGQNYHILFLN